MVAVPACRLSAGAGLAEGGRGVYRPARCIRSRRLFWFCPGRPRPGGAAARTDGRLALPGIGAALWRSRSADCPRSLQCGWRVCRDPADGGCRSRPPPRPPASRSDRGAGRLLGPPLSPRGISASAVAQSVVPVVVFRRGSPTADRPSLRLMPSHLIVFARAPSLGTGKRRLARDIGDVAALRFERLTLARLLRRLGRDRRWRLRIAVTPDRARHPWRLCPRGIPVTPQGTGDLGERMRRALAECPPGPAVLIGADIPALGAHHIAEAFRLLGRHDL